LGDGRVVTYVVLGGAKEMPLINRNTVPCAQLISYLYLYLFKYLTKYVLYIGIVSRAATPRPAPPAYMQGGH